MSLMLASKMQMPRRGIITVTPCQCLEEVRSMGEKTTNTNNLEEVEQHILRQDPIY